MKISTNLEKRFYIYFLVLHYSLKKVFELFSIYSINKPAIYNECSHIYDIHCQNS